MSQGLQGQREQPDPAGQSTDQAGMADGSGTADPAQQPGAAALADQPETSGPADQPSPDEQPDQQETVKLAVAGQSSHLSEPTDQPDTVKLAAPADVPETTKLAAHVDELETAKQAAVAAQAEPTGPAELQQTVKLASIVPQPALVSEPADQPTQPVPAVPTIAPRTVAKRRPLLRRIVLACLALLVVTCGLAGAGGTALMLVPAAPGASASVQFAVHPGDSLSMVADHLQRQGVVRNAQAFDLLANWQGEQAAPVPGVYALSPSMPMAGVLDQLAAGQPEQVFPSNPSWLSWTPQPAGAPPVRVTTSLPSMAPAPSTQAAALEVMNPDTGGVYLSANADQERAMASTTKMMTALVAVTHANIGQRITVESDLASLAGTGASVAGLRVGETFTLRELLYALLLPSGDDAAIVIADGVAGSQDAFVSLMNQQAQAMGLTHTHFANVHGLDAPDHYSSAADLAVLGAALLNNPTLAQIVATPEETLPRTADHQAYTWQNTNQLLFSQAYPGVLGIKTGFTGNAGYCLVFAAQGPYGRLVGVVLGEPTENSRFVDARALFDWGFALEARLSLLQRLGGLRAG